MPRPKLKCPGSLQPPKEITRQPGHTFCGYGICPDCGHECALVQSHSKIKKIMAHRDRRIDE